MFETLIKNLQRPEIYPHPVKYFRIIETHISVVILTGDYAYKIKKPVDMEFLDFSTLEKRHFYCQEELRLNKSYAPDLYLEVIAISGTEIIPSLQGEGQVLEYAIKMREFPQDNLFGNLLKNNALTQERFVQLAELLANIHLSANIAAAATNYGSPEQIYFRVQQNFDQIRPLLKSADDIRVLENCEQWANAQYQRLHEGLLNRKRAGFIRECHGDLHLFNIVLYHDKPLIFDSIEFSPDLRWTDVMADVGFLTMDLHEKNHTAFATIFLNQYLTATGDYDGLQVLRFYQAYRALVRAKINIMQIEQVDEELAARLLNNYRNSMKVAENYILETPPQLIIMYGVSGSGKTTRAKSLAATTGAIHLRSDVERKRILSDVMYTEEMIQKVYEKLYTLTQLILSCGYSVIVDATFLKKSQREMFEEVAERLSLKFHIVPCEVDEKTRAIWLKQRRKDYSDADLAVVGHQQEILEPLTLEEQQKIL